MSAAIVIPVFRSPLLSYEEASIKQAIGILANYDHVLIVPRGYDVSQVIEWYNLAGKTPLVKEFDAGFFESTVTYNRLMLSPFFYEAFARYDFMLVYQTDAFIFRDELKQWIDKDYDYVGAPWIDWIHTSFREKNKSLMGRIQWRLGRRRFDAVGNGGFSLRKVCAMTKLLGRFNKQAENYHANEDLFFAFEAKKLGSPLKIPSVKQALKFAFDENPETSYKMAGNRVPMGCHGWHKHLDFWKSVCPAIDKHN